MVFITAVVVAAVLFKTLGEATLATEASVAVAVVAKAQIRQSVLGLVAVRQEILARTVEPGLGQLPLAVTVALILVAVVVVLGDFLPQAVMEVRVLS